MQQSDNLGPQNLKSNMMIFKYFDNWNPELFPRRGLEIKEKHVVEKSPKMSHFLIWHFPLIIVLIMTCLVTLFDRKFQPFKKSPNETFLIFSNSL